MIVKLYVTLMGVERRNITKWVLNVENKRTWCHS